MVHELHAGCAHEPRYPKPYTAKGREARAGHGARAAPAGAHHCGPAGGGGGGVLAAAVHLRRQPGARARAVARAGGATCAAAVLPGVHGPLLPKNMLEDILLGHEKAL